MPRPATAAELAESLAAFARINPAATVEIVRDRLVVAAGFGEDDPRIPADADGCGPLDLLGWWAGSPLPAGRWASRLVVGRERHEMAADDADADAVIAFPAG